MRLEEVLPAYRDGKKVKRKVWGEGYDLSVWSSIGRGDIEADDWELVPKPPVVIDLVEYADGYEFEFDTKNYYVEMHSYHNYSVNYLATIKSLGCVYMTEDKAKELIENLNSGEWILK